MAGFSECFIKDQKLPKYLHMQLYSIVAPFCCHFSQSFPIKNKQTKKPNDYTDEHLQFRNQKRQVCIKIYTQQAFSRAYYLAVFMLIDQDLLSSSEATFQCLPIRVTKLMFSKNMRKLCHFSRVSPISNFINSLFVIVRVSITAFRL